MIKQIDVRFFTIAEFNIGTCHKIADSVEITETQFNELVSDGGTIEYERFTTFWNGSDHVSLTVICYENPDHGDLDIIE